MTVRMAIDQARVQRLFTETKHDAAERAARRTQDQVKRNIREQDRIRTGEMLNSIVVREKGPADFEVRSDLFYTIYQEKGIGPVTPVRAKALVFKPKGSGAFVFAQRTKGFEGGKFFENASRRIRLRHFLP